jgi:cytochrome b involved in lipid metabolism
MQDIKKHNTDGDCWTVINGKIFNMSLFSSLHSGGPNPIISVCGKDGTIIYTKQH